MLRVIKESIPGLRTPLYASLTLSFASFGDAFLYPFLPQYAEAMGVPFAWIGILLSINRLIRIVFNPFVVRLFTLFGIRKVTIIASAIAIISTAGYGFGWGLVSLVLFRILWGMAFAILRMSTLAYALQHEYIGLSMGVGKSIQEVGPMIALWLGPVLLNYFSADNVFIILALFSIPSLVYAFTLPVLNYVPVSGRQVTVRFPSLFNCISFGASFIIEGALVIVAGTFLVSGDAALTSWDVTSLTAGYLAYRRLCFIVLSPFAGTLADRIGFTGVFNYSLLFIIAGLIMLLAGWVAAGLIVIFTFNSVHSTLAPGGASNSQPDKIRAVSLNASWRDVGAASGAFIGGLLLSGSILFETFTIATFILTVLLAIQFYSNNKRH